MGPAALTPGPSPAAGEGNLPSREAELADLAGAAARALAAFGLVGAEATLLEHKQNTTYRVRDRDGGRFLLRLAMAGRYEAPTLRSELVWLASLRGAGIAGPEPVAAPGGELLVAVDTAGGPRHAALFRWLPGRPLGRSPSRGQVEEVGRLLARLHRHAEGFVPPAGFARPTWDLPRLLGEGEVLPAARLPAGAEALITPHDRALLDQAAQAVRAGVAALGEGMGLFGMIHTDLEPDNVIVEATPGGETLHPIDFEHCGPGYYLYDVGSALLALADRPDFPALRQAFLLGYESVRPLPAAQQAAVEAFLVLRCLFALRLLFLEIWDLPGNRADAATLVPFMLAGVRAFLAGREGSAIAPAAMSTVQLLAHLRDLGIRLWVEEGALRFAAPKGALTPEWKAELSSRKGEILAFLGRVSGPGGEALPPLRRYSRDAPPPLSFAQERLWFIDQLEPGTAAYNIPVALALEGAVAPGLLEESFHRIVRRHEVLRTRFATNPRGEPVQVIAPALRLTLPVVDLAGLPPALRLGEQARLAAANALAPFDLAAGPLVRATLLPLAPGRAVLLFAMHHIVSDAWSGAIVVREMAAIYEALANGGEPRLSELPVQYADFGLWQREWLSGRVLDEQLAYWRRQLAGAPAVLDLPLDRPRPAVPSFAGERRPLFLSAGLSARLAALAQGQGATLFMVLLAAWSALLARITGQEDVLVGSPIAGRRHAELEALIGFFVNTLVLRSDVAGNPGFAALLARTRKTTLDAFAHQDLPFERLVGALLPDRNLSTSPFFQSVFVLQNVPASALRIAGVVLERLPPADRTAPFELSLSLEEGPAGLQGSLSYRRELFGAATIERLGARFERLLAAVVEAPERPVGDHDLLAPAERAALLVEWNDTAVAPAEGGTVAERVAERARELPDRLAVEADAGALSYGELAARAAAVAGRLRRLGVGPESLVAVLPAERAHEAPLLLGIWQAGAAYLPLDPAHPPERRRLLLADSGAALVADERLLAAGEAGAPAEGSGGRLAYVIYTSGSTGKPKGVEVEHAALANLVAWHQRAFAVTGADRATRFANSAFDAAAWELWPYLAAGATVVYPDAEAASAATNFGHFLTERGITVAWAPPLFAETLAAVAASGAALRILLTGGDRVRLGPPPGLPFALVNTYGPTEAAVISTWSPLAPEAGDGPPDLGRPIDNARTHVLDAALQPVPAGSAGEIAIGGAGLARGYRARPELTAERFVPDPFAGLPGARLYRTGDLARQLADGRIDFLGRIDHQVKLRGFRIELGEVEAALLAHPHVQAAVVAARDDAPGGRALVAYLVAAEAPPASVELRRYLAERLPEPMVPAHFVVLPALPMTSRGKVDRKALPPPAGERPDLGTAYAVPRPGLEQTIAGLWGELLERERIGRHDNFFDLGGHSLLLAQLRTRLTDLLGRQPPMLELYRRPTVATLAEYLAGDTPAPAAPAADRSAAVAEGKERLRQRLERRRR